MKLVFSFLILLLSTQSFAISIWPTIAFVKGADLCQYQDAYGRSRSEMAQEMVDQASQLMSSGASGSEALKMLVAIDGLIDKNRRLAVQGYGLDVTLEATLKSYVDKLYQDLRPRNKNINFNHAMPIVDVVRAIRNGQRPGYLDDNLMNKLDAIAYGTYAYAPDCRGNILVTIHVMKKDGSTLNFQAQGKPQYVMSDIAARMFEMFQRAQFPSTVRMGSRTLQLIGAPGTPVDSAPSPDLAEQSCEMIDARLPTRNEYEYLSMLGDWNGGIGLGHKVWALKDDYVLAPDLRNPTPVRQVWEVNAREYMYYCVR